MAIDTSGRWWTGDAPVDLDAYLSSYTAKGYPVTEVVHARCECGGDEFRVRVDDESGCAERRCVGCGRVVLMLDSAETVEEAELGDAACPCGNATFQVAVGFAMYAGEQDVRWVYVGLRCLRDGVLGCYTDWKIDYSPSLQLLTQV